MKKIIGIITLLIIHTSFAQAYEQVKESFLYYVIPAESEVSLNGEVFLNDQVEAQMYFHESGEEEQLQVGEETSGVRVFGNDFVAHITPESQLTMSHALALNAGSIYIKALGDELPTREIIIGDLEVQFYPGAEFLAFVSGEGTETVVKVISGEVEVNNDSTQQTATLEALQATSTDQDGRLLIPFAVDIDEGNAWWNAQVFQSEYELLPIADAGDEQRVLGGNAVTLNGSRSEFKTGDIFEWKLVSAPNGSDGNPITRVAFNTINIVKPVFTPEATGEYQFSLQITNQEGRASNTSYVDIYVGKEFLQPVAIFPDVPADHPNNLAITYLYKKDVMKGSPDPETGERLFRPDQTINRVEILKTIFENLQSDVPEVEEVQKLEEEVFLDVKPDHWFAPYVVFAKEQGIIKGNDGLYRPADEVVLVEAIKIIVEASRFSIDAYKDETQVPYPDAEQGAWYNPYLFFVKKYELFDVDAEGHINPAKKLTRAEFAEIIYRIESVNLEEKKGFISGKVLNESTGIGKPDAEVFIYKAVQEGAGDGGFVTKGELYDKVPTNVDGTFTVSLPVHTKFYLEAVTEEDISTNKIITEVKEDEVKSLQLLFED